MPDLTEREAETEVLQAVLDYVEAKSGIAFALSTEVLETECRLANEAAAKILPAGRRLAVLRAKAQRAREKTPDALL